MEATLEPNTNTVL